MHAYWSADLPKEIPRRQQPRSGWAAGLKTEEEERACATTKPALVPGAGAGGGVVRKSAELETVHGADP